MTPQQLKLYELLGSKELTFGCRIKVGDLIGFFLQTIKGDGVELTVMQYADGNISGFEMSDRIMKWKIIGHPPTIADLHKWLNENFEEDEWINGPSDISYNDGSGNWKNFRYYTSIDLIDQPTETLDAIIELIDNHK